MKINQEQIYKWVIEDEGPYCNDEGDDEGMTTWGITHSELAKWWGVKKVSEKNMRSLTQTEAKLIYTAWYWDPLLCDAMPDGIDYMMFDAGLLHGIDRAKKWLQIALKVQSDGKIGPKTLAAVNACVPTEVIDALTELRRRRVRSHPDRDKFGRGWTNRITRSRMRALTLLES